MRCGITYLSVLFFLFLLKSNSVSGQEIIEYKEIYKCISCPKYKSNGSFKVSKEKYLIISEDKFYWVEIDDGYIEGCFVDLPYSIKQDSISYIITNYGKSGKHAEFRQFSLTGDTLSYYQYPSGSVEYLETVTGSDTRLIEDKHIKVKGRKWNAYLFQIWNYNYPEKKYRGETRLEYLYMDKETGLPLKHTQYIKNSCSDSEVEIELKYKKLLKPSSETYSKVLEKFKTFKPMLY